VHQAEVPTVVEACLVNLSEINSLVLWVFSVCCSFVLHFVSGRKLGYFNRGGGNDLDYPLLLLL